MLGVQSLGPMLPRRVSEGAVDGEDCRRISASMTGGGGAGRTSGPPAGSSAAELERDGWVVLLSVLGLGPVSFGALLGAFGSAQAVLAAATEPNGPGRLVQALTEAATEDDDAVDGLVFDACAGSAAAARRRPVIGAELAGRICDAVLSGNRTLDQVRALGLNAVTLEDPAYPVRLRQVEMPPPLLFVRGSTAALNSRSAVAVVGTRRPSDKGRLIAGWIGSAVARAGAVVVSGLALGIDGAAHASVVAENGLTLAVLGGGHARLFPKAHERLADAIVAAGGAIVSELMPDTTPTRGTFPRRNRLISGLSDATVVVEAGRRSGALITAGWALEQGRECFLVPGPFDSPTSAGCHAFLRSFPGQARVVCGIEELIEDLDLVPGGAGQAASGGGEMNRHHGATADGRPPGSSVAAAGRAAVMASLGPAERALAAEVGRGPATVDQLAARTSMTPAAVLSALTLLELRGLVTGAYGRYSPAGTLASWSGIPRDRPE